MRLLALLPLNSGTLAKSRLRGILDDEARTSLVRWMAGRTLTALCGSGVVDGVAVVSPDPHLLAWARERGAVAIAQDAAGPYQGLNAGVELGRCWALAEGADAFLVVLGDLPLLVPDEVRGMVAMCSPEWERPLAVLAPDRDARGTNALLLRPPDALAFAFGTESLARHLALARAAGVEVRLFEAPGTRFDVDYPADIEALEQRGLWSANVVTASTLEAPELEVAEDARRGVAAGGETR